MEHRFVHMSSSKVTFIKSGRQRYLCILYRYLYVVGTTFDTTRRSFRFIHFVASISVVLIWLGISNVNRRENNYRIQKTIMNK